MKAKHLILLFLAGFTCSLALAVHSNTEDPAYAVPIPKSEGVCKVYTDTGTGVVWEIATLITPNCVVIVRPEKYEEVDSKRSIICYVNVEGHVFSSTIEKFVQSETKFSDSREQNFRIVFGYLSKPIQEINLPEIDTRTSVDLTKKTKGSEVVLVGHKWPTEKYNLGTFKRFDALDYMDEFMAFEKAPKMAVKLCLESGKNLKGRWEVIGTIDTVVKDASDKDIQFPDKEIEKLSPFGKGYPTFIEVNKTRNCLARRLKISSSTPDRASIVNLNELIFSDFYPPSTSGQLLFGTKGIEISFPEIGEGVGHADPLDLGSAVYTVGKGKTMLSGIVVTTLNRPLMGTTNAGFSRLFGTAILPASYIWSLYEKIEMKASQPKRRKHKEREGKNVPKNVEVKQSDERGKEKEEPEDKESQTPIQEEIPPVSSILKEGTLPIEKAIEVGDKQSLEKVLENTCWVGVASRKAIGLLLPKELHCFLLKPEGVCVYHTVHLKDLTSFGVPSYKGNWCVKENKGANHVVIRLPKCSTKEFTFIIGDDSAGCHLNEVRGKNKLQNDKRRYGCARTNLRVFYLPSSEPDILEVLSEVENYKGIISHFAPFYDFSESHFEHYKKNTEKPSLQELTGLWNIFLPDSHQNSSSELLDKENRLIIFGTAAVYKDNIYDIAIEEDFSIEDPWLEKPGYFLLLTAKNSDLPLRPIKLAIYTTEEGGLLLGTPFTGLYVNSNDPNIIYPGVICTKASNVLMVSLPREVVEQLSKEEVVPMRQNSSEEGP